MWKRHHDRGPGQNPLPVGLGVLGATIVHSGLRHGLHPKPIVAQFLDFAAVTHMKRSFHDLLTDRLGAENYYLDEYGHVQSVDQILALDEGLSRGLVDSGDVICFVGAGTGYTWAATVLEWRG